MFTFNFSFVATLYQIYLYLIIAYVLLSWVPNARDTSIGRMIGKVVEPYLSIFRRFIPPIGGMIDLSPIVAIFALGFVAQGVDYIFTILFR